MIPSCKITFKTFFGSEQLTIGEIIIIFGLYTGLIKYMGIDIKFIYKCALSGKIDELFNQKYKYR